MYTTQTNTHSIVLQSPHSEAEIFLFGAILNRYAIQCRDGNWFNTIQAYTSPQDAQANITHGFHSAKLSPFVCRLAKGRYQFQQQSHQINKHMLAGHAIHGLIYDATFHLAEHGNSETKAWAVLTHQHAATAGYPFAYNISIQYTLSDDGLSIATTLTNTGTSALPIADGWHPYFQLGGSIDNCALQINSQQQLEFNEQLLPTGRYISDGRFQQARQLSQIQLDNSFVLADTSHPACILSSETYQLSIFAEANYPILQVYIPDDRRSIAIENLSGAPDCFNNHIGLITLQPQQSHCCSNRYLLSEKEAV